MVLNFIFDSAITQSETEIQQSRFSTPPSAVPPTPPVHLFTPRMDLPTESSESFLIPMTPQQEGIHKEFDTFVNVTTQPSLESASDRQENVDTTAVSLLESTQSNVNPTTETSSESVGDFQENVSAITASLLESINEGQANMNTVTSSESAGGHQDNVDATTVSLLKSIQSNVNQTTETSSQFTGDDLEILKAVSVSLSESIQANVNQTQETSLGSAANYQQNGNATVELLESTQANVNPTTETSPGSASDDLDNVSAITDSLLESIHGDQSNINSTAVASLESNDDRQENVNETVTEAAIVGQSRLSLLSALQSDQPSPTVRSPVLRNHLSQQDPLVIHSSHNNYAIDRIRYVQIHPHKRKTQTKQQASSKRVKTTLSDKEAQQKYNQALALAEKIVEQAKQKVEQKGVNYLKLQLLEVNKSN